MSVLVLITVHFHNQADVEALVENAGMLRIPPGWRLDIVVVDNSGEARPIPGAAFFRAPENLGYLGGAAFGLQRWKDENEDGLPDWVAVVNPDVSFPADALEELLSVELDDRVEAVAPAIFMEGTISQNPFFERRPARLRMWLYTVVFRSRLLTRILDWLLAIKRQRSAPVDGGSPRPIYAGHGSAILLRKSFFERGGTLQFGGFMYGEEIHLAEQVRATGGTILYVPQVRARHAGGSTTARTAAEQRRRWHLQSACVLWNQYFRRGAAQRDFVSDRRAP